MSKLQINLCIHEGNSFRRIFLGNITNNVISFCENNTVSQSEGRTLTLVPSEGISEENRGT
jgi:hypothetical protein